MFAGARDFREDGMSPHRVAVNAKYRAQHRDGRIPARSTMAEAEWNLVSIGPVRVIELKGRARLTLKKIGRLKSLNAVLLGISGILRITTRNKHPAVK